MSFIISVCWESLDSSSYFDIHNKFSAIVVDFFSCVTTVGIAKNHEEMTCQYFSAFNYSLLGFLFRTESSVVE